MVWLSSREVINEKSGNFSLEEGGKKEGKAIFCGRHLHIGVYLQFVITLIFEVVFNFKIVFILFCSVNAHANISALFLKNRKKDRIFYLKVKDLLRKRWTKRVNL